MSRVVMYKNTGYTCIHLLRDGDYKGVCTEWNK